jgi:2-polyprenyl-6-methoxyphenol hydroxylase-like FAD-dependent oxidoreductase
MRALVAGAGLGGLTASLALNESGVETGVFERAGSMAEIQVGIGMVLWPNGMNALATLGQADAVREIGHPLERVDFLSAPGGRLNTWSVGDIGRKAGMPALALSRGELHRLLATAHEERGHALSVGSRLSDFEEREGSVVARFEAGREEEGDVLIGADGIASGIRRQLTGQGPPEYPPYAGYTIWHSIIPFDERVPPGVFFLLFGRGSRFAYYRLDDERVYWSGIGFVPAGNESTISKAEALEHFGRYTSPVPTLIEATHEAEIQRHDIYGGEVLERWGAGRVTLLGDAAHPMTTNLGQGAGMAIEDGVVLARCVAEGSDPIAALRAYERRRQTRTGEMMVLANRLNSDASLEGRLRCWWRDRLIQMFFHRALGRRYEAFIVAGF